MSDNQQAVFKQITEERAQLANIAGKILLDSSSTTASTLPTIVKENFLRQQITPIMHYLGKGVNYEAFKQGDAHPPSPNPGPNYSALSDDKKVRLQQAIDEAKTIIQSPEYRSAVNELIRRGLSPVEASRTWALQKEFRTPTIALTKNVVTGSTFNQAKTRELEVSEAAMIAAKQQQLDAALQKAKAIAAKKGPNFKPVIMRDSRQQDYIVIKDTSKKPPNREQTISATADELVKRGLANTKKEAINTATTLVDQQKRFPLLPLLIAGAALLL